MLFECEYIDNTGKKRKEIMDFDSKQHAYDSLSRRNFIPTKIEPKEDKTKKTKKSLLASIEEKWVEMNIKRGKKRKIKIKDLSLLFYNLSTMLESGLAVDNSLEIILKQTKKSHVRRVLESIIEKIKTGSDLNSAFSSTEAFPNLVSSVIQSGEESGSIDESFKYLAGYYEKQSGLKSKIVSAMIYPIIVIFGTIFAIYFISTNVLPKIMEVIEDAGGEVGISTKILMGLTDFFSHGGVLVLALIIGVPALVIAVMKKRYTYTFDKMLLKIPIFGEILKKNNSIQFTNTLYILLSSGITANKSLDIAINVIQNKYVETEIEKIKRGVMKGESISKNMNEDLFGDVVCNIIKVGEETGELVTPLKRATAYLDAEMQTLTTRLTEIMTPLVILMISGLVGFVLVGTISPIMEIYKM